MAEFKHDWIQVENEFINDCAAKSTLKEIAEKYAIPHQSVRRYAAAHKWHSKRFRLCFKQEHGIDFEDHLRQLYQEAMRRD